MKRIPIDIVKIKLDVQESSWTGKSPYRTLYLFKIEEKGQEWEKTFICDREALLKFRDKINELVDVSTTAEILGIPDDQAKIIDEHYKSDKLCTNCQYKLQFICKECLFIMQSPLERILYLELKKAYINFQPQYAINWKGQPVSIKGKTYGDSENNFKDVLTVVDFYIDKGNTRLCVYTDGHTYHERTEEQAQHDKKIDRKLQELGFTVWRYTGKDVNEDPQKIINEIKNLIS